MRYIKVRWEHNFSDEPVTIYSELDDYRNEIRKVEIYRDGRVGYASIGFEHGGSALSKEPLPPFEEINEDAQFNLEEIGQEEFDVVWERAVLSKF